MKQYLRNTAVVRPRLERRWMAIECTIKQLINRRALKNQTHVKNAWIGYWCSIIVIFFVELIVEDFDRCNPGEILTILEPNSMVIKRRKTRIIVKQIIILVCLIRLDRFNLLLLLCNSFNWLGVRLAASIGALVDAWEKRWGGKSPLRRAFVAADNEEWELVLNRGFWVFWVCVCCIDRNET